MIHIPTASLILHGRRYRPLTWLEARVFHEHATLNLHGRPPVCIDDDLYWDDGPATSVEPTSERRDNIDMIDWTPTAQRLGYPDELRMWFDLYVTRGLSISQLATKLDVSRNTVRMKLEELKIPTRTRGGPNNQKLDVTDALIEEIKADGIATVAKRLELSYTTVYKRVRPRLAIEDLLPEDVVLAAELDRETPEDGPSLAEDGELGENGD